MKASNHCFAGFLYKRIIGIKPREYFIADIMNWYLSSSTIFGKKYKLEQAPKTKNKRNKVLGQAFPFEIVKIRKMLTMKITTWNKNEPIEKFPPMMLNDKSVRMLITE